jgi:hypothetical protein
MIKPKEEKENRGIEIDLSGPEGNAFVLMAYANRFSIQLGHSDFKRECILREMRLTDYEGLLHTFDREFGTFVTLWR